MALKFGPALLTLISFVAIMLGVIFHAISINELQYKSPPATHFDTNVTIDDKPNNLLWFLQVTDLHLSSIGHFDRETDFAEFAKKYVDIIRPDVVLVTGDITDGREPNTTFGTGPQEKEWVAYHEAISHSKTPDGTNLDKFWLDIRGNHDNFNVYRPKDPKTLYRRFSIQGKQHERNYNHIIEKDGKNYTFIGVDEVQTPGLKIPFNFIGIVKDEDLSELKKFKEVARNSSSQYTIWFAHYPTSSIASPNEGLRNVIDGPYLCGHFHTIGNWVTHMHATQQPGFVEAELGDWKYNRRIRLAAIDHQLFNFVDVGFNEFPIALITNPKKAEYSMPKYEPVDRMKNSTHIRVIVFSNATIEKVEIYIDGQKQKHVKYSGGPLWVSPWNPDAYATGLHTVQVYVEDSNRSNRTFSQTFSLDTSRNEFSFAARLLLRAYFKSYVMAIFFFIVVVCTLPLIALRLVAYRHHDTGLRRHYKGTLLFNIHLLSNIDRLFIPIFTIPVWMAIGPHFIGHLVDEAVGACFVWGVLIDGTFIHTGITYNVGSIFLLFIHVPELVLLTYQVSSNYKSITHSNSPVTIFNFRLMLHICITALQLWMGTLLLSAYGTMSFLTSFPFVWCIFIYAYCWYQCATIGKQDFSRFNRPEDQDEQQALTGQRTRDDKSSTSDHSIC